MNIVRINNNDFVSLIKGDWRRNWPPYKNFFDSFYENGNAALNEFRLDRYDAEGSLKPAFFTVCRNIDSNTYGFNVFTPMHYAFDGLHIKRYAACFIQGHTIPGSSFVDLYIEPYPVDYSTQAEVPSRLREHYEESENMFFKMYAGGYAVLFAKIQTNALKYQKKIIKLQTTKPDQLVPTTPTPEKVEPENRVRKENGSNILLCPGITYSFVEDSKVPKHYKRHIEAWSVRGHYRQYKKSGKTVFIKPHIKGSGRLKDTTYSI